MLICLQPAINLGHYQKMMRINSIASLPLSNYVHIFIYLYIAPCQSTTDAYTDGDSSNSVSHRKRPIIKAE